MFINYKIGEKFKAEQNKLFSEIVIFGVWLKLMPKNYYVYNLHCVPCHGDNLPYLCSVLLGFQTT